MKLLVLFFFFVFFAFADCQSNQDSKVFQDNDGALTTKDITQNRDLTHYEQGGYFRGRTNLGKDGLDNEKQVRDFIWQHWNEKKRGYIKLSFGGTDTSRTIHYFIEPNEKSDWIVTRKVIYQSSDGKFELGEDVLYSLEQIENKENSDWFLVSKSPSGQITERLPVY